MQVYPMRIPPGEDVPLFLQRFVTEHNLKAAFIITCVGSVKSVSLRFATDVGGNHAVSEILKNMEICSLVGTISQDGSHLHGTFSDEKGGTISGHIVGNMVVQTTAEVVVGNANSFEFKREFDNSTGFRELIVKNPQIQD